MGDWRDDAACRGVTPSVFYLEQGSVGRPHPARKFCSVCPVKSECLEWAMTHIEQGVWGGLTPNERKQLRRQRNRGVA